MRLFETKSRAIFEKYGIPLSRVAVASTPQQVRAIAQEMASGVVIRPCILTDAEVALAASSPSEAETAAEKLLGSTVSGFMVKTVLVEARLPARRQTYAYVSLDRWREKPFLLVSPQPLPNIHSSRHLVDSGIPYQHFSLPDGLQPFQTRALAKGVGFRGRHINTVGSQLLNLHRIWMDCDAEVVAACPLVETEDGQILVSGAILEVDEDALFRHPEFNAQEEIEALFTEREKQSRKMGNAWVDLDGDIGMFVAGSGMGMSANDVVVLAGGKPADFSDIGGGPSPERVAAAFGLLFNNPGLKGVLAFYFGGISRCDDFAKGMVAAVEAHHPTIPIVVKMAGTNEKEGRQILDKAMTTSPELFRGVRFVGGTETSVDDLTARLMKILTD